MIREVIPSDFPTLYQYYKEFEIHNIDLSNRGPFSIMMVYELDGKVVGFISYSIIYDRAELDYIYVEKNYRKNSIASALMKFCLENVIENDCQNITLEVNVHNDGAINLYKKFGFSDVAIRRNYYHGEDALLMIRELI